MVTWSVAYYISEWLIRLVMLFYVPQRRPPAAARTWLLLIFLLPWPGLLLYAIIGRPYLPRRRMALMAEATRVMHHEKVVSAQKAHLVRPELPPPFRDAVVIAEKLGDFGIVGGNRFELLVEYEASVERLVQDIDGAAQHVHLLYYIFANDATGRQVGDALIRACGRGVRCRVLMDGLASKGALRHLSPILRAGGVEVHAAMPVGLSRRFGRVDLRNHRKIAVVDGRVAYFGSQNLVDADFKSGIVYEELVSRAEGPVVLQLQAVFLSDWYLETEEHL